MNRALFFDVRRAMADEALAGYDGVTRWTESVSYGGLVDCTFYGRQYAAVLAARPRYLESGVWAPLTNPGLHLIKPTTKREVA